MPIENPVLLVLYPAVDIKSAVELSDLRKKTAAQLAPRIQAELHEMGMPDAQLSIELTRTEISSLGQDSIEVKFTSNKGQKLQDISKVASGGEVPVIVPVGGGGEMRFSAFSGTHGNRHFYDTVSWRTYAI